MKFYGEPFLLVRVAPPIGRIKRLRFDDKGIIDIDDPRVIRRMKRRFDFDDPTELETKSVPELKEIAKGLKISTGKKGKADLIEGILAERRRIKNDTDRIGE